MTALRDHFDVVHKKQQKTANGVIELDYISWSQVADRLDDVALGGWNFTIMGLGEDWCHGRLTILDQSFENIGYAENADQTWKKEVLKDAVSDAFKRCAALAGVGRYLYDKDGPAQPASRPQAARRAAPTPLPPPESVVEDDVPPDVWAGTVSRARDIAEEADSDTCREHGIEWTGSYGDRYHRKAEGGYCRLAPGNVAKKRTA